jgi:hypothetical protein
MLPFTPSSEQVPLTPSTWPEYFLARSIECSLLDHHTRVPRPTARCRAYSLNSNRLAEDTGCSNSNVASRGCLCCIATAYHVRPWALRGTPKRATHLTGVTYTDTRPRSHLNEISTHAHIDDAPQGCRQLASMLNELMARATAYRCVNVS